VTSSRDDPAGEARSPPGSSTPFRKVGVHARPERSKISVRVGKAVPAWNIEPLGTDFQMEPLREERERRLGGPIDRSQNFRSEPTDGADVLMAPFPAATKRATAPRGRVNAVGEVMYLGHRSGLLDRGTG